MSSYDTVMLNELKNEFVFLDREIDIPNFHVKGITEQQRFELTPLFNELLPDFLKLHDLLNTPNPKSDLHFVHYVREFPGKFYDFLHVLKFDLKFSGDASTIIEKGNSDYFPSYKTNRLYYKSYLIPVRRVDLENGFIKSFEPDKILQKIDVESDQHFHTFAVFDEMDTTSIVEKLYESLDYDIFSISNKIYSFLAFENFTFALNVLLPFEDDLKKSVSIIEPLWVYLRDRIDPSFHDFLFGEYGGEIIDSLTGELDFNENVSIKKEIVDFAKDYYSRFSFSQDEDLMLRRWRKLNVKNK